MNAVDTSILLRYIVEDESEQRSQAKSFFGGRSEEDPAFVSLVVLVELTWVLRRLYRYTRAQVQSVLIQLVETAGIVIEDEHSTSNLIYGEVALKDELADHLIAIAGFKAGCSRTLTFDGRAAKHVPGMELLT